MYQKLDLKNERQVNKLFDKKQHLPLGAIVILE